GQGLILEANHAAAALLDCPKHFVLGKPLGLFLPAGHRSRFYESLATMHRGGAWDQFETRMGRRDRTRIASVRVGRIGSSDYPDPSFHWLVQDITDSRRVEAARDELRYRLVTVQEEERRRVARELHDSVAQLLTALALGIRSVRDVGALPSPVLER